MQELTDDHRGHTIITSVSGPSLNSGPWVASYSAWEIEENNSYRAVAQGTLPGTYQSTEIARAEASLEAKKQLDNILDSK